MQITVPTVLVGPCLFCVLVRVNFIECLLKDYIEQCELKEWVEEKTEDLAKQIKKSKQDVIEEQELGLAQIKAWIHLVFENANLSDGTKSDKTTAKQQATSTATLYTHKAAYHSE